MSEIKTPLVSIVIPCYNHVDYVQDCIQSIIDQTYQNIELII
ncbi:TPA: glycosyltransferase, partial [Acinetobacter baumannii]